MIVSSLTAEKKQPKMDFGSTRDVLYTNIEVCDKV